MTFYAMSSKETRLSPHPSCVIIGRVGTGHRINNLMKPDEIDAGLSSAMQQIEDKTQLSPRASTPVSYRRVLWAKCIHELKKLLIHKARCSCDWPGQLLQIEAPRERGALPKLKLSMLPLVLLQDGL